jgi:hypothetical protein
MDYGAKHAELVTWCRRHASQALISLSRLLAALSTKLSIVTVLGIGAISIMSQEAASTLRSTKLTGSPAIEIVRPKQVIIDGVEPDAEVEMVASRRHRRRATEPEHPTPVRKDSAIAIEPEPMPAAELPAGSTQAEPAKPEVWSDAEVISALRECVKFLAPIAAEVELAQPVKQDQCGAAAPVMLRRVGVGSDRLEINPPATINCAMVVHLHEWVTKVLQPAAQEAFGSPITRLAHVSGYSCRNRNGSERLSEHALANAIDIAGFVTADGRSIEVARHWGPTLRDQRDAARVAAARAKENKQAAAKTEPAKAMAPIRTASAISRRGGDRRKVEDESFANAQLQRLGRGAETTRDAKLPAAPAEARQQALSSPEGLFLRRLHKGACAIFGTVLGPEANEAHRDHFHLDLAPRRRSAFCE